ncbi:uncharacterized protein EDB91DRAFT_1080909 [Suillus paluster]|uniref:uncharacterized protein n=1 Tax=Suillus paluster TaxID=48578 RepID=UPI001B8760D8|nr:uncharacterized protein EDB91DRAFT_1080909 [Suillus paluster]KAG1744106.1 hypothetical protein EDB91DRAFT_1080909 [Suillus paluster]
MHTDRHLKLKSSTYEECIWQVMQTKKDEITCQLILQQHIAGQDEHLVLANSNPTRSLLPELMIVMNPLYWQHCSATIKLKCNCMALFNALLDLHGAMRAPPHTHLIALAGSHTQDEHQGSLHVVLDMWVQWSVVLGKLQLMKALTVNMSVLLYVPLMLQWATIAESKPNIYQLASSKGSQVHEYHCVNPQDPIPTGGANNGFDDGIPNVWISTGVQVSEDISPHMMTRPQLIDVLEVVILKLGKLLSVVRKPICVML